MVGCASTTAYLGDRGRDARDMVNLGVELGSVGVSAQVGPLMTGAIYTDPGKDANGWGLANRGLGRYEYGEWQAVVIGYKAIGSKAARGRECGTRQIACVADGTDPLGWNTPCYYALGNVDARVGLGLGIHAGIHLGEIVDFLLGWFGADIMGDDVALQKLKETKSNQASDATSEPAPGTASSAHQR